jgi:phosphocarrier protein HPr
MSDGEICKSAMIDNMRGLHARAAARFVKLAETFKADVTVAKDEMKVSGRSIMGLMMLAAVKGSTVQICGTGEDAIPALEALTDLIKRKFDEE